LFGAGDTALKTAGARPSQLMQAARARVEDESRRSLSRVVYDQLYGDGASAATPDAVFAAIEGEPVLSP
jgi:hypothetical protein